MIISTIFMKKKPKNYRKIWKVLKKKANERKSLKLTNLVKNDKIDAIKDKVHETEDKIKDIKDTVDNIKDKMNNNNNNKLQSRR